MPPRKAAGQAVEASEELTAIVLADSFTQVGRALVGGKNDPCQRTQPCAGREDCQKAQSANVLGSDSGPSRWNTRRYCSHWLAHP